MDPAECGIQAEIVLSVAVAFVRVAGRYVLI